MGQVTMGRDSHIGNELEMAAREGGTGKMSHGRESLSRQVAEHACYWISINQ